MIKALAIGLVLLAGAGCVLVYAPEADRIALQMHDQQAEFMPIDQQIPIDPRVADRLDLTGIAGIKGDVANGNAVASPSAPLLPATLPNMPSGGHRRRQPGDPQ